MTNPESSQPAVLSSSRDIIAAVQRLAGCRQLWVDVETADWWSAERKRLSLIQILPDNVPVRLENVLLLDVLDQPALIDLFIQKVMTNTAIKKVFHNKSFDVAYLGGHQATAVRCTLQAARLLRKSVQIPGANILPEKNTLQSLATHFGLAPAVSKVEQKSNWGKRPLSHQQLLYAARDVLYLRGIDCCLSALERGQQNWRADAVVRSIASLHMQHDFVSDPATPLTPSAKSKAFELLRSGASIDDVVTATQRTEVLSSRTSVSSSNRKKSPTQAAG